MKSRNIVTFGTRLEAAEKLGVDAKLLTSIIYACKSPEGSVLFRGWRNTRTYYVISELSVAVNAYRGTSQMGRKYSATEIATYISEQVKLFKIGGPSQRELERFFSKAFPSKDKDIVRAATEGVPVTRNPLTVMESHYVDNLHAVAQHLKHANERISEMDRKLEAIEHRFKTFTRVFPAQVTSSEEAALNADPDVDSIIQAFEETKTASSPMETVDFFLQSDRRDAVTGKAKKDLYKKYVTWARATGNHVLDYPNFVRGMYNNGAVSSERDPQILILK